MRSTSSREVVRWTINKLLALSPNHLGHFDLSFCKAGLLTLLLNILCSEHFISLVPCWGFHSPRWHHLQGTEVQRPSRGQLHLRRVHIPVRARRNAWLWSSRSSVHSPGCNVQRNQNAPRTAITPWIHHAIRCAHDQFFAVLVERSRGVRRRAVGYSRQWSERTHRTDRFSPGWMAKSRKIFFSRGAPHLDSGALRNYPSEVRPSILIGWARTFPTGKVHYTPHPMLLAHLAGICITSTPMAMEVTAEGRSPARSCPRSRPSLRTTT